jgi:serine phosphatase RsbU (regulator of sigma subunit)
MMVKSFIFLFCKLKSCHWRSVIEGKIDISVITSINNKINSRVELPELLTSIMDTAKELLHAEGASLLLSDLKTGDLIFNIVIGDKGDIILGEKVPRGKGIAGIVAESGKYLIVNDAQNDPRFFAEIDKMSEFFTKNILCLPMLVVDDLIGVLEVVNSINPDGFTKHDLDVAVYIANQAAIAIDNRRLQDDLSRRIDELTALYDISQSISFEYSDISEILNKVINSLVKSMGVRRASISMLDEASKTLCLTAFYGLPDEVELGTRISLDGTVSGYVCRNMDPMIVADICSEIPENIRKDHGSYTTGSFISIPVMYKKESLGVLSLADKINGKHFDSFDLRVISTVSNLIAEAVQNIKNQKNIADQKKLEHEISIAAEIQKKILPEIPEQFKSHLLKAYNKPAKVVGGDFYDFFVFDENKYAVLVADVSGKGIPAAMFMGLARNVVRAEGRINMTPATLLKNANKYICRDSEHSMFVTLFYVLIDSHNSIITYGSAGHNNQLLIKGATGESIILNSRGRPLGIFENVEFEEKVIMYEKGDILLMYTDGVSEALSANKIDMEEGEKRISEIVMKHINEPPDKIIERFIEAAESSSTENDNDYRDDFTILSIRF